MNNYEYILSDISILKGVGKSLVSKFKRRNIHTIFDLILSTPSKYIDRSVETKIKDLHIGKIQTVTVFVEKYNFPRIRNLPNKVFCSDYTAKYIPNQWSVPRSVFHCSRSRGWRRRLT